MDNEQRALVGLIEQVNPRTLITIGLSVNRAGGTWQKAGKDDVCHLPLTLDQLSDPASFDQTVDLALISDTLEQIPREAGEQLLGTLRNLGVRQIAVLVSDSAPWTFRDFIALGFRRQPSSRTEAEKTLYTYNLDTYNHKRTWNNPDYWANPEMWGKAWW